MTYLQSEKHSELVQSGKNVTQEKTFELSLQGLGSHNVSIWGKSCQADGRGRKKLYMGICLKCLRNRKKVRVVGLLEAKAWMEETEVRNGRAWWDGAV